MNVILRIMENRNAQRLSLRNIVAIQFYNRYFKFLVKDGLDGDTCEGGDVP